MKKFLNKSFFTGLVTVLSFVNCSCSDDGDNGGEQSTGTPQIVVTPESLDLGCDASRTVISVSSDADWSIRSDADWCKVFPTGGVKGETREVTVTVDAYSGFDARETSLVVTSSKSSKSVSVRQSSRSTIEVSATTLNFGAQESSASFTVKSNVAWIVRPGDSWFTVTPASGNSGETVVTVACSENGSSVERRSSLEIKGEDTLITVEIIQLSDAIIVPEGGYTLVWNDEFNDPAVTMPDTQKWYYDVWDPGYVNNELQRYVAGERNGSKTAEISDGILRITAMKQGGEVISARLNTRDLWMYGYFEARLKLPKGKGTWPAFWMMPANGGDWPHCGEIDIMEEVGTNPNYTSSSIHCTAYNHTIGTQKTAERYTAGAEDEFHVYALEWTSDYIRTLVDGKELFRFANDKKNDQDTWPFDKPFHPILNLAWGGSWGGMNGVDESALPAVYEIDYVRVFQKL